MRNQHLAAARLTAILNIATAKGNRDTAAREVAMKLIDACADLYCTVPRKLTLRDARRNRGTPQQSEARAVMAYLLCDLHNWAYAQAGRALRLDHSSIIAAVNRAAASDAVVERAHELGALMVNRYGRTWWAIDREMVREGLETLQMVAKAKRGGVQ